MLVFKNIVAFLIDLLFSYVAFGYVIAFITGNATSDGFYLSGLPAIIWFGLVFVYCVFGSRILGTTLGRKALRLDKKPVQ
jgi:hypothetical protein